MADLFCEVFANNDVKIVDVMIVESVENLSADFTVADETTGA